MKEKYLAVIEVLIAGVCFGFLGIFGKQLFAENFTVGEILSFRFIIAAAIIGLYILCSDYRKFIIPWSQIRLCILQGMMGYALFASFYFKAIEGVSVPLAAMLLFTYPVVIHLIAWVLRLENLTLRQWLSLPLVVIGLGLVLWGEIEIKSWWAVASGLAASISYSLYVLASNRWQKKIDPIVANFYVILSAAICLFLGYQVSPAMAVNFSMKAWLSLFGLAGICSVLAMVFFLKGLQKLKASEAAVISTSEPIAAAILSFFILGQPITWQSIFGIILVIAAVVLSALH